MEFRDTHAFRLARWSRRMLPAAIACFLFAGVATHRTHGEDGIPDANLIRDGFEGPVCYYHSLKNNTMIEDERALCGADGDRRIDVPLLYIGQTGDWVCRTDLMEDAKGQGVVGDDVEDGQGEESSGVRTLKTEVAKRVRVVDESRKKEWSWRREVTGHFGNCSPGMRGSFKQPPPGRPVDQEYDRKHEEMGDKVTDLEEPTARKNFRVVIIRPDEVESVCLTDPDHARRQQYFFDGKTE